MCATGRLLSLHTWTHTESYTHQEGFKSVQMATAHLLSLHTWIPTESYSHQEGFRSVQMPTTPLLNLLICKYT